MVESVGGDKGAAEEDIRRLTAASFAYEWERYGGPRPHWAKTFADYIQPWEPAEVQGKTVLDVGTGSGRIAVEAARNGALVAAVDLGASIEVARRNLPDDVLTVQADAERMPFAQEGFDLVISLGVLHHLPDTERALRVVAGHARPGGHVHIYLYWVPERPVHRLLLRAVTAARRLTVRLPHRLLALVCYPVALALAALFVLPQRLLRRLGANRLAGLFPLQMYVDYPFGVLLNDQFDRFSAPLERRFTRAEMTAMLERLGLEDVVVLPNHGWIGHGRVPAGGLPAPA
jgi:SAM-dependent methyltransferase